MADYTTYYGEYNLEYWVKMILSKEVELPPYQRDFVWSEKKVQLLIKSLSEEQYIPPIVIGSYKENGKEHNYILDGQQRLSAILLAWLGYFPKGKDFEKNAKVFGSYNDDIEEDEEISAQGENIRAWSFKTIQDIKSGVKEKLEVSNNYKRMDLQELINSDFMLSKRLGFAYIRPKDTNDSTKQKRYFSTMFRNINISAVDLTAIESRSSLYWLDEKLKPFFQPDSLIIGQVKIVEGDIDFARYLALLAEFKKCGTHTQLASGYSGRGGSNTIDRYIEEYIYDTVDRNENSKFYIFEENYDYENMIKKLNKLFIDLQFQLKYMSIIDADCYLFGLIYGVVYENKSRLLPEKRVLLDKIEEVSKTFKNDQVHTKSPNALKYIRQRVEKSIQIYGEYLSE